MLITAKRLFDGRADSIVEDPLIEVSDGQIVERDAASGLDGRFRPGRPR